MRALKGDLPVQKQRLKGFLSSLPGMEAGAFRQNPAGAPEID
jgi:hypothetical protein